MQKTIAFFTDAHLGDPTPAKFGIDAGKNLQLVLQDIAGHNYDEVIFGGDITEIDYYRDFFDSLQKANSCYRIVLGNHDSHDNVINYFKQPSAGTDELYYFHDDEVYRYIYMDSSSGKISNAQLQWLAMQLETPKKIIVFIHHPVLDIKTGMDTAYPLKNRDAVQELIVSSSNPITIFCGHYHMPDVQAIKHITQYCTPAVSFQVQKQEAKKIVPYNGTFGYRVIELTDTKLKTHLRMYRDSTFVTIADDNTTG